MVGNQPLLEPKPRSWLEGSVWAPRSKTKASGCGPTPSRVKKNNKGREVGKGSLKLHVAQALPQLLRDLPLLHLEKSYFHFGAHSRRFGKGLQRVFWLDRSCLVLEKILIFNIWGSRQAVL